MRLLDESLSVEMQETGGIAGEPGAHPPIDARAGPASIPSSYRVHFMHASAGTMLIS